MDTKYQVLIFGLVIVLAAGILFGIMHAVNLRYPLGLLSYVSLNGLCAK